MKTSINDEERELWVRNTEGLYNSFSCSRLAMKEFIKANRKMIDAVITATLNKKPNI